MCHVCYKMAGYLLTLSGFLLLAVASGQDPLCNDKLIRSLPDDHLSASSSQTTPSTYAGANRGRLNTTHTTLNNGTILAGGWSPSADTQGQHIQANFDEMTMINGVFTQGRNQGNGHVTLFKMEYTEDGKTWQTVNNDIGVEQVFGGNKDADSVHYNPLDCPIFAKGIRIIPLNWDKKIGLRFEVNGCYLDNTLVALPTGVSPSSISSTFLPGIVSPFSLTTTTNATAAPVTTTGTTVGSSTLITTLSTQPSTTTRMSTTAATTTPTTTIKTTPTTTKPNTPSTKLTTTPGYNFHPGVMNPFGTTSSTPRPTVKLTTQGFFPFMPGVPTPFGPAAAIG